MSSEPTTLRSPRKSFQAGPLEVCIHDTQSALAADAAARAQDCLQAALARQQTAAAILATGNSQLQFLDALIALGGVDWSRITLFHMDEYLGLDDQHRASFRRYMRERVEARVRPRAFHYLAGDTLLPLAECERYTRLLRAQPIDLCCLGIGENGHIAFNDPPVANFDDPAWIKVVELDDACRQQQVNDGCFPTFAAVPTHALTLTIPALMSGAHLFCSVPGKTKRNAVTRTLTGSIDKECPSTVLRLHPHCTLYADTDSYDGW